MKYLKTYEQAKNGITFKKWLSSNPHDINTTIIDCSSKKLIDLNGIEKFKNLRELYCSYNQLTELPDLSQCKNLEYLYCDNNQLPYDDLKGYIEWHKKTYPWIWEGEKYNL